MNDTVNTEMVKELENTKMHISMLKAQAEALNLQINKLPPVCRLPKEPFYPYARTPPPQKHLKNDKHHSMGHPLFYVKCEESHVASSAESQENLRTLPTPNPFEDTKSLDYYHPTSQQQHQVGSGEYGHPSKYYQLPFGPSYVGHPRPNASYYDPYNRK
jgi:hypothetical protein